MNRRILFAFLLTASLLGGGLARKAYAQAYGVELHNTVMPASGGMGGASVARPQDVQSAFANPGTLTQFHGTQFSFGGAWAEATITMDNLAELDNAGVMPYEAKSGRPGSVVGNIALTQDFSAMDMPVTVGLALLTTTGLGVDYRSAPESNGSSAELFGLATAVAAGVQVTERLSLGASMQLTSATLDGPFAGIGAAVPAYALRGIVGGTYDVNACTTVGAYWWTRQSFQFDNGVLAPGSRIAQDINLDLPETFGIGIANNQLMEGRLLVAVDLLYKRWDNAEFFESIWEDQFILQVGAQYTTPSGMRLRLGYSYAENATRDLAKLAVGGVVPPDLLPGAQYIQAMFPAINRHRLTGGFGMRDVLPGIDMDMLAGAMFRDEEATGLSTASVQSYWVGTGLTWRFGRGSCTRLPAPCHWD